MPPKRKRNILKTIFIPVVACGCGCGPSRQGCPNPSTKHNPTPKRETPSNNSANSSPLPSTQQSAGETPTPETPPSFQAYTSPLFPSEPFSPSHHPPTPSAPPRLLLSPCPKINESVAMAKESVNPFEDFRESMKQMIDEREIQTEDELKELLRCFLDINPPAQHNVVVRAFVDICSDLRPPHDRRGKTLGKLLRLYINPVDECHAGPI